MSTVSNKSLRTFVNNFPEATHVAVTLQTVWTIHRAVTTGINDVHLLLAGCSTDTENTIGTVPVSWAGHFQY